MEIFCNSPEKFNDPFDCSIDIINKSTGNVLKKRNGITELLSLENAKQMATQTKNKIDELILIKEMQKSVNLINDVAKFKKITEPLIGIKKSIHISCFTKKYNNELMWAHYADSHKGICIGYDINLKKINYDDNYPLLSEELINGIFNERIENFEISKEVFMEKYLDELKEKIFLTKSKAWDYEEEWRLIQLEPIKKIEKSQIKSIYFGLKTDENNIKTIIKILSNLEIDIPIYKMEKVNEKFLFEPKLLNKDLYK